MKNNTKKLAFWFPLSIVLYEVPLYLSNNLFLPAFPLLKQSFHASTSTIEWSIALWFLGASTLQLILSPLCEHFGRKKMLLSGGLIFLLATNLGNNFFDKHFSIQPIFRRMYGQYGFSDRLCAD